MAARFRNVFAFEEESPEWQAALEQFPNRVPRFERKEDAIDFTQQHCRVGSNPDAPDLLHSVSTLISWEQVSQHLLPRIDRYNAQYAPRPPSADSLRGNRFGGEGEGADEASEGLIYDYLTSRLDLSVHRDMSHRSTLNTLRYMFFHMKCGIYLMIRDNRVVVFCPFVNKDYKNSWGGRLKIGSQDGTIGAYYDEKSKYYRRENVMDADRWWANGNIICNEYSDKGANQYWGDHFLLQVRLVW
ncbi:hypothetical protein B484DRAFT_341225 [Ochromonadaceae sp. CCMP2298]|nr:hypothetical protein B484DRAFT_341225 [Ochromonadaceae sp. CCMP2298]